MKITNIGNGIVITNYTKTFLGIICAVIYPILYILTILDFFSPIHSQFDICTIILFIVMTVIYGYWLTHDFYATILRHKIIIDDLGITEKRLVRKSKHIEWNDLEEYTCEVTAAPYRTHEAFLKVVFRS